MIRVLICDDQEVVCEGLRVILGTDPELSVVGIARNGLEALEMVETTHPDVVMMDLKMPVMNGVQATRGLKDRFPDCHVLVLTTFDADEWVFDAIRSGASGYLLKDTPAENLIEAIKQTAAGKTPVDPVVAGKLFQRIARNTAEPQPEIANLLSERERGILALLARGRTNAEIAHELYLSEGTVRNYVSAILDKLQVTDRTQAALIAVRYGLVDS